MDRQRDDLLLQIAPQLQDLSARVTNLGIERAAASENPRPEAHNANYEDGREVEAGDAGAPRRIVHQRLAQHNQPQPIVERGLVPNY